MKSLKLIFVAAMLALTTACSDDKDSCNPNFKLNMNMEEEFSTTFGSSFTSTGDRDAEYEIYTLDGYYVDGGSAPMDSLETVSLSQERTGSRTLSIQNQSVQFSVKDSSDWVSSRTNGSLTTVSDLTGGVVQSLKAQMDKSFNHGANGNAKVCSSTLKVYLLEDGRGSADIAIHLDYKAEVQGKE